MLCLLSGLFVCSCSCLFVVSSWYACYLLVRAFVSSCVMFVCLCDCACLRVCLLVGGSFLNNCFVFLFFPSSFSLLLCFCVCAFGVCCIVYVC